MRDVMDAEYVFEVSLLQDSGVVDSPDVALNAKDKEWLLGEIKREVDSLKPHGWKKAVHYLRELGPLGLTLGTLIGIMVTLIGIMVTLATIAFRRSADEATFEANTTQALKHMDVEISGIKTLTGDIVKSLPPNIRDKILALTALTVPTPGNLGTLTPNELRTSLENTVSFVNASFTKKEPGDPEALTTARDRLQNLLKSPNLPSTVKPVATSAFLYVRAYEAATAYPKIFSLVGITLDCRNHRPSEAVAVEAPLIPGVSRPPLVNQTAALVILQVPNLEDAAVYGVTVLGCSPVPGNEYQICRQDLTYAVWVKSTFKDSTVVYDGGPLHLVDTSFVDCQFEFGTDERSREALQIISEAKGKPVTIDFSGFPNDYRMTPTIHSGN